MDPRSLADVATKGLCDELVSRPHFEEWSSKLLSAIRQQAMAGKLEVSLEFGGDSDELFVTLDRLGHCDADLIRPHLARVLGMKRAFRDVELKRSPLVFGNPRSGGVVGMTLKW
jgi:hypothetical protein